MYYWLVAAALIFIAFLIAGNYFVVSQLQREASRDTTDYSAIKAPPSSSEKFLLDEFSHGFEVLNIQGASSELLGMNEAGDTFAIHSHRDHGRMLELWDKNTKQKRAEIKATSCTKVIDGRFVYCETEASEGWKSLDINTGETIFDIPGSDIGNIEPYGSRHGLQYVKVNKAQQIIEFRALTDFGEERWKKDLTAKERCGPVAAKPVVFCSKPIGDPDDKTKPNFRVSVLSTSDGSVQWEQDVVGEPWVFSDGWVASLTPRPNIEFSVFDFNNQKIDMQWLPKFDAIVPNPSHYPVVFGASHTFPVRPLEELGNHQTVIVDVQGNVVFHSKYTNYKREKEFVKPGEDQVKFRVKSSHSIRGVSRNGRLVMLFERDEVGPEEEGWSLALMDTETGNYLIDYAPVMYRSVTIENGIFAVNSTSEHQLDVYYPRSL